MNYFKYVPLNYLLDYVVRPKHDGKAFFLWSENLDQHRPRKLQMMERLGLRRTMPRAGVTEELSSLTLVKCVACDHCPG